MSSPHQENLVLDQEASDPKAKDYSMRSDEEREKFPNQSQ